MTNEIKRGEPTPVESISKWVPPPVDFNKSLLNLRKELPAYQMFNDNIYPIILGNQVTIIAGATGCGKTTQIPQMVLDGEIARGNYDVKIIVTQPRRIAAISVANRVAQER